MLLYSQNALCGCASSRSRTTNHMVQYFLGCGTVPRLYRRRDETKPHERCTIDDTYLCRSMSFWMMVKPDSIKRFAS